MQRDIANETNEDRPITDIERWALQVVRATPYGKVTLFRRDGEIYQAEQQRVLKPGEQA